MSDFSDASYRHAFRHTSSHILAQAVKRLYPQTRLAIGPAIDSGYYYDFDRDEPFAPEELGKIEDEMKKIVKANYRSSVSNCRVKSQGPDGRSRETYKVELIDDLPPDAVISFYRRVNSSICVPPSSGCHW
jgi:threonyl-tRNA synthetase